MTAWSRSGFAKIGLNPWNHGFDLYKFWGVAFVYMYFQIAPDGPHHHAGLRRTATSRGARRPSNLGASNWRYWRHIGLPVLAPAVLGGMFLLFGSGFSAYATAEALTGGTIAITPIQIGAILQRQRARRTRPHRLRPGLRDDRDPAHLGDRSTPSLREGRRDGFARARYRSSNTTSTWRTHPAASGAELVPSRPLGTRDRAVRSRRRTSSSPSTPRCSSRWPNDNGQFSLQPLTQIADAAGILLGAVALHAVGHRRPWSS